MGAVVWRAALPGETDGNRKLAEQASSAGVTITEELYGRGKYDALAAQ